MPHPLIQLLPIQIARTISGSYVLILSHKKIEGFWNNLGVAVSENVGVTAFVTLTAEEL